MSNKLGARKRRLLQAQVDAIKVKFLPASAPQSFDKLTAEEIRVWRDTLLAATGVSFPYVGLDRPTSER